MKILIADNGTIPVTLYGGTERVIWCLGKELTKLGHRVTFLVRKGSHCDFAPVLPLHEGEGIAPHIPDDVDVVHLNFTPTDVGELKKPYLITIHGNSNDAGELDQNAVFVSRNHAERYGSDSFVHNGLDWSEYSEPDLGAEKRYFHFLGNAAWRLKNVKGAIAVIAKARTEQLRVLGGVRFNIRMGIRFTFSPRIRFYGMVGGEEKDRLLIHSKGLLFPVRWHEPFGLSIIESLYFGCPVFGTPYGSLPEIVTDAVGFLSNKKDDLADAIKNVGTFSPKACHDHAAHNFNSKKMAEGYLERYEMVLSNEKLNKVPPRLKEIQKEKFLEWR
jgi:glycosyltransferase involved in cell wall biosynthesis